jgi:SAM-dependent methyltransferase
VGCGGGESFAALQRRIGPGGAIIGLDPNAAALRRATARVARHRWTNVRLICAEAHTADLPAHTADIPQAPGAALFCQVHEVMRSAAGLANILNFLRPGAVIAAGGGKWPPTWLRPVRSWVTAAYRPFVADFAGFDRPWHALAQQLPGLRVTDAVLGWTAITRIPQPTPTTTATTAATAATAATPMVHTPPGRTPNQAAGPVTGPPEGPTRQRLLRQVRPTVEPLAAGCQGLPLEQTRAMLRLAWLRAFGVQLAGPILTDCAHALSSGGPWADALRHNGWADRR